MSGPQSGRYDTIARRWLALIERRQENFLDLCDTGRWRHYYTEPEFLEEMRKVLRVRDQWAALAGQPLNEELVRFEDQGLATDQERAPDHDHGSPPQRADRAAAMPVSPWPD